MDASNIPYTLNPPLHKAYDAEILRKVTISSSPSLLRQSNDEGFLSCAPQRGSTTGRRRVTSKEEGRA